MTKLMEWLAGGFTFTAVWLALLYGYDHSSQRQELQLAIQFLPVIVIFLFGIYAVVVVLYRTFTFNDCKEAAEELQEVLRLEFYAFFCLSFVN